MQDSYIFQALMTAVKLLITFKRIQRDFILAARYGGANKKRLSQK
jgi:hypothetical protein